MARINNKKGNLITLGLGTVVGNAVTYANTVSINTSRSLKIEAETETGELIELTDMSAPAQIVNSIKSVTWAFDGSGTADANAAQIMTAWITSGQEKQVKVFTPFLTLTGNAVCTSYQVSGERMGQIENECTVISSGDFTITNVI